MLRFLEDNDSLAGCHLPLCSLMGDCGWSSDGWHSLWNAIIRQARRTGTGHEAFSGLGSAGTHRWLTAMGWAGQTRWMHLLCWGLTRDWMFVLVCDCLLAHTVHGPFKR